MSKKQVINNSVIKSQYPKMQKLTHCFLPLLIFTLQLSAQNIVTISSGTDFYISAGTIVSFDSLVFTPSVAMDISGANSITKSTTLTHSSPDPFVSRTFHFASTFGSYSGAITEYYAASELGILTQSQTQVAVFGASNWSDYTSTNGSNFATATGLSNISLNEIVVGSTITPLAITTISLNAIAENNFNNISWTTNNESDAKTFFVQKSSDAVHWTNVSPSISANDNSQTNNYSWDDHATSASIIYYRILQINKDDESVYSSIVTLRNSNETQLIIFPNPVSSMLFINSGNAKTITSINLFGSDGKQISLSQNVNATNYNLNTSSLSKGAYLITIKFADGTTNTKSFIKQ
ncbi:MAG TPA: T9SS type A sorting domain-containing protein [Puia sp.]|jgi:hypothetical protein|nr:T9SS type A sorting domain-containing protein [Puia sp.]